jgi:hypothetical protein
VKVIDLALPLYYELKEIPSVISAWDILDIAGIWDAECSTKDEAIEKITAYLELWKIANIDASIHICENHKMTLED